MICIMYVTLENGSKIIASIVEPAEEHPDPELEYDLGYDQNDPFFDSDEDYEYYARELEKDRLSRHEDDYTVIKEKDSIP